MKSRVWIGIKIFISLLLLTIISWSSNLSDFTSSILSQDWLAVACCIILILAGIILSAHKWQVFLSIRPGRVFPLYSLCQIYLIGLFFNNFLPTAVGGDVVRIMLLGGASVPRAEVAASVLAERVSGLAIVLVYGVIGLLCVPQFFGSLTSTNVLLAVLSMSIFLLLLMGFWFRSCGSTLERLMPLLLRDRFRPLMQSLQLYLLSPSVLWRALWTSIVFQLLVAASYFVVAYGLHIRLTFIECVGVVSLVTILTLLPLSLNGLGIREGGFVYLLGNLGISQEKALALSLSVYGIVLLISLIGGWFFIRWKREHHVSLRSALTGNGT